MVDSILNFFSILLQMDLRDHHNIPFALPLLIGCFIAGSVAFVIVKSVDQEHKQNK